MGRGWGTQLAMPLWGPVPSARLPEEWAWQMCRRMGSLGLTSEPALSATGLLPALHTPLKRGPDSVCSCSSLICHAEVETSHLGQNCHLLEMGIHSFLSQVLPNLIGRHFLML